MLIIENMFRNFLVHFKKIHKNNWKSCIGLRASFSSGVGLWEEDLSIKTKHAIESHWTHKLYNPTFSDASNREKYYVLSMFPYPSGQLHMGHVRVYTISDTMARFHRMNGKNVLHPMGWDAFGLPAENAAMAHNTTASKWTQENIVHMKDQLNQLGCSFDWSRELATCNEDYYKWTQYIFLKMFEKGMVYQREALVNWDPVDLTVLADEQVDSSGCSWRSGSKVEKKLLNQWFIRTTKFAKKLYEGLDSPVLEDWKDIIKLQKHWIGECDGYLFELPLVDDNSNNIEEGHKTINIWTRYPEHLKYAAFVAISPDNILNKSLENNKENKERYKKLNFKIKNSINGKLLPVFVTNDVIYETGLDTHLGVPHYSEFDKEFSKSVEIDFDHANLSDEEILDLRETILNAAKDLDIGGFQTSSKLRDWLISRQRYWGTPIPIIHCKKCKAQPVPEDQLPVTLPKIDKQSKIGISQLQEASEWIKTVCPSCGGEAHRETDTMDTFVDSSWYYLRFMDSKNTEQPFSVSKAKYVAPVDLYIGGKEHAVLHLYYARFISYFLHSIGFVEHPEPFKRLLVQGMVMGRTYRVKASGRYLTEDQVEIINAKKNQAKEKSTGLPVVMSWEKMSKSKGNGVDPQQMFKDYGTDTTRLLILADVAPTSHRNWTTTTFPGILNWQHRLWLTVKQFINLRTQPVQCDRKSSDFITQELGMFDARNYYIKGATFNYFASHQLSVAISKMQGLTNSIRRATPDVIAHGLQYERALAAQLMLLAPMAPHFASELWAGITSVPRIEIDNIKADSEQDSLLHTQENEIFWNKSLLEQPWPEVDQHYQLDLAVKVNGFDNCVVKLARSEIDVLKEEAALKMAFDQKSVNDYVTNRGLSHHKFRLYPGCEAVLELFTHRVPKQKKEIKQS